MNIWKSIDASLKRYFRKFAKDYGERTVGPRAYKHLRNSLELPEHSSKRDFWRQLALYFAHALFHMLTLQFIFRIFFAKPQKLFQRPPGERLLVFSEFIFTRRTFEGVIRPIVADMREEYFEALSQNSIWKARWVRIRGTYSFFAAIGLDRTFAFVSFFVKAWKSVN